MIIPRATEKAYVAESQNTYIFFVPKQASKQAIAQAIAEAFKVTVLDVRTAVRKGKPTRFSRGKHAFPGTTFRQDHKVAYVTVKAGDKIPVFETPEEKAKDEKATKTEKNAKKEKAAKKVEKPAEKKVEKETK